jgi:hypothetical protein
VAESVLTGAAAIQLTATKVSVSKASAAKFKGIKLLEQVVQVVAAEKNNSSAATEDVRMMEDGKRALGQNRKRAHDPDDDLEL